MVAASTTTAAEALLAALGQMRATLAAQLAIPIITFCPGLTASISQPWVTLPPPRRAET